MALPDAKQPPPLIDVHQVDFMFPIATAIAFSTWVFLLLFVHILVPSENHVYLDGPEREAASAACYIFFVSTGLSIVPMIVRTSNEKREISGIVWAGIAVQFIAMCTNALLAWTPTVVVVDPVTHARVYMVRWCEWIPLAGLMTFFSESVDCTEGLYGVLIPVIVSLGQSLSCLMAIILPFCPNFESWALTMFMAFVLFLAIFPRLWHKYEVFKTNKEGLSLPEMERSCRVKFGYHLLLTCSCVWTALVVFYFVNMIAFHYYPDSFLVQSQSLPMILDTFIDVLAKALYMKIIVNVHETVFDAEGRSRRQLSELKKMITALWESSSDVIVLSVRNGNSITTMISPTFPAMIGATVVLDGSDNGNVGAALVVKSEELPVVRGDDDNSSEKQNMRLKSSAYFVDATDIPYYNGGQRTFHLPSEEVDEVVNREAESVVAAAWNGVSRAAESMNGLPEPKKESLMVLDLHNIDGDLVQTEIKVSRRSGNAVIATLRDVTERYKRFDAERRVHSEALARQKDAQAVNRFTRHEIKNGLLAGIELCQEVSKRVGLLKTLTKVPLDSNEEHDPAKCISELDSTLHEVLDTVLAEAMAREVVHESYSPKLERVDVCEAMSSTSGLRDESTVRNRFPIHVCPSDMPFLLMDPQLLKYIHRNAVSNACKYGLKGGKVTTEIHYFEKKGEFEMDVINEPGPHHHKLMMMVNKACEAVFAQGTRLNVHNSSDDDDKQISSGDGAWIMQKCAKTLGGYCRIRFDCHQTVFSFRCKVQPYKLPWKANEEFQVPPDTWGIAFDDSAIQRKLMGRILSYAGVEESRTIIQGKNMSDIKELDKLLLKLLSMDSTSKVLVLMDENLDYECDGVSQRLSGSKFSEQALHRLKPDHLARTFILVRSANDSDSDVAIYKKRTHGFFPKASIRKERVRELLAPEWYERFQGRPVPETITTTTETSTLDCVDNENRSTSPTELFSDEEGCETRNFSNGLVQGDELLAAMGKIDELIRREPEVDYSHIWSQLHTFKGDLMAVEDNGNLEHCVGLISDLRGCSRPNGFEERWKRIQSIVNKEVRM